LTSTDASADPCRRPAADRLEELIAVPAMPEARARLRHALGVLVGLALATSAESAA
jgi:hypothetical protein